MKILGIMSGSSLDGIDLALCEFGYLEDGSVSWKILKATTIAYSKKWIARLRSLPNSNAREIALADYDLGYLFGKVSKEFLTQDKNFHETAGKLAAAAEFENKEPPEKQMVEMSVYRPDLYKPDGSPLLDDERGFKTLNVLLTSGSHVIIDPPSHV